MLSDLEKLLPAVDDVPDAAWDLRPVSDFEKQNSDPSLKWKY